MLSILIPTYNEKQNIEPLVRSIEAAVRFEHEIIIIDDNSPDGTSEEVLRLAKGVSSLKLVRRKGKLGLTSAITAGLGASKGETILVMDADLSHPPEMVPRLVDSLVSNDIAIGSRLAKGGGVENWPMHRRIISDVAGALATLAVGARTSDPMSGFFAAKRKMMLKTRFRTKGYKLLLNILADNRDARLTDVPYLFKDRLAGKTKLDVIEMLRYVLDLVRIRFL
jgi:dolichol-phosphate mannosyltransferase